MAECAWSNRNCFTMQFASIELSRSSSSNRISIASAGSEWRHIGMTHRSKLIVSVQNDDLMWLCLVCRFIYKQIKYALLADCPSIILASPIYEIFAMGKKWVNRVNSECVCRGSTGLLVPTTQMQLSRVQSLHFFCRTTKLKNWLSSCDWTAHSTHAFPVFFFFFLMVQHVERQQLDCGRNAIFVTSTWFTHEYSQKWLLFVSVQKNEHTLSNAKYFEKK